MNLTLEKLNFSIVMTNYIILSALNIWSCLKRFKLNFNTVKYINAGGFWRVQYFNFKLHYFN